MAQTPYRTAKPPEPPWPGILGMMPPDRAWPKADWRFVQPADCVPPFAASDASAFVTCTCGESVVLHRYGMIAVSPTWTREYWSLFVGYFHICNAEDNVVYWTMPPLEFEEENIE